MSNSDNMEYLYKGTKVDFLLQTLILDDYVSNKVIFDYKDIRVDMFYIEELDNCFTIINKICEVIDKLGGEGYKNFNEYYHDYHSLQKRNIVIEGKVYKYFHSIPASSGKLKYHHMSIDMNDGTRITNHPSINQDYIRDPFERDVYNFKKSAENIKNNALNYYKKHGVVPKDECINQEKTAKLSEILLWIKENGVQL
ncbi:hypothetical protein [Peribacillus loiseleuriae]|uniref:Uncharacterized protein n=1 Tax=Peribacillus loiseleuriae TaxID=1679170 RepID=A0A0K9GV44_9BACI|nr:hypothetical protein [Peribacillus loiseleuriae]KMY50559.1 hypothetical protein AC625_14455 [Peribacillus loiseleuriae]